MSSIFWCSWRTINSNFVLKMVLARHSYTANNWPVRMRHRRLPAVTMYGGPLEICVTAQYSNPKTATRVEQLYPRMPIILLFENLAYSDIISKGSRYAGNGSVSSWTGRSKDAFRAANLDGEQQSIQHFRLARWPLWLCSYLCVARHPYRRSRAQCLPCYIRTGSPLKFSETFDHK